MDPCFGVNCSCKGGFPHHKNWGPDANHVGDAYALIPSTHPRPPDTIGFTYFPFPVQKPSIYSDVSGILAGALEGQWISMGLHKRYTHFRFLDVEVPIYKDDTPEELHLRAKQAAVNKHGTIARVDELIWSARNGYVR